MSPTPLERGEFCVCSFADLFVGHRDVRNCLIGAGEMAQSAKCLFQTNVRSWLGWHVDAYNLGSGEVETGGSLELAGQSDQVSDFLVSERPCLKTQGRERLSRIPDINL